MPSGTRANGKLLAWVLRHAPAAVGVELDAAGWVSIDALLEGLRGYGRPLTRAQLERCVAEDPKARFTISDDAERVRAAQGHSVCVELGLPVLAPPASLFHGTPRRALAQILSQGLVRGERHDVHLSGDPTTAIEVGRRRGEAVVLHVDAAAMHEAGLEFRRSDNGVWLTQSVPAAYLRLAQASNSGHESPVPLSPTLPESVELDVRGLGLHGLAWGPSDARPVLACHGWLDNAATMSELAPLLCEALPLRIVSLDLPGHGLSDHKSGTYHFIDWVADVISAADALGWARFSLLGHSMGAGISTLVAGTVPKRIERCVLLEGIGPATDLPAQAARRLARSLRVEAAWRDKPRRLLDDPSSAVARLREAISIEPASAQILIQRGLVQVDGGWTWRADPRLRIDSRMRLSEDHLRAFLDAIRCPVLMIAASEGWPHDAKLIGARQAAIRGLTRVEIAGHHHVHLDDPEAVAAQVIPFLAPLFEAEAR